MPVWPQNTFKGNELKDTEEVAWNYQNKQNLL